MFGRYFEGSTRFRVGPDTVSVVVPSRFHAEWLQRRFGDELTATVHAEASRAGLAVRWHVDPSLFSAAPAPAPHAATPGEGLAARTAPPADPRPTPHGIATKAARRTGRRRTLKHSLDDYVVGAGNRLAYAAATKICDHAGDDAFGMLFLHGPCGVGKTHLLQGVARRWLAHRPGARVRYTTGERFANEYIASVQSGGIDRFRDRYRAVDLLCIDDVHFIAGKKATQSEFLHTFEALDLDGARVVFASDAHPRQIADLNARIVSRCVAGMVVQMHPPDRETRARIVRVLAGRRRLPLDDAAVAAIVESCPGSARELEGAVLRVEAARSLLDDRPAGDPAEAVNAAAVRRALGATAQRTPSRTPIRLDDILRATCEEFGVELSELLGTGRHRRIVIARSLAAALARELTTHSYPEIARAMNRRNHSTVVTACQRVRLQIEQGVAADIEGDMRTLRVADLYDRLRARLLRAG